MTKITAQYGKNIKTETRNAWIQELLKDVIEHSQDNACYADNTIHDFYLYGFKGIVNMTDEELLIEIQTTLEYKYHEQGN